MAMLKCKMCGGDLDISEGVSVCECEYCGTRQTVPTADNEKKMTLFARANRLRAANEFDKASGIYESIAAEFPEEAEAYWGLVLCKYGIEYVDDPETGKKVPTCHRSSFDSVMEDVDFEQACENADGMARRQYREEAKQIEEIRKGIIEVSGKEDPYDIFICYKETDESGNRTIDSVIAQDVYDALTSKGYRVFFSRISLEDKLGTEYEPYIFAALNSAKVMLAFGTDYEHYNAVWVKNEWSRFLKLMEKDKTKHLIPCYKDIDAYDMPKEFRRLQAQDMGKVGVIQDLLRGIDKIFGKDELQKRQGQPQVVIGGANVESLLKRGYDALEDGVFEEAKGFFNDALNSNAESMEAYLGLFMAEIKVRDKSSARALFVNGDYTDNRYWKRAKQYAREGTASELDGWESERADRMKREAEDEAQRREEARRKAEETKRKKEEEARKKEEETRKKKAVTSARKREELVSIRSQLAAIKEGRYVLSLEDEKKLARLRAQADAAKSVVEQAESELSVMPEHAEIRRLEREISEKQSTIAGLGFFKGKERKKLQEQVSVLEQSLDRAKSIIEDKSKVVSQLQKDYCKAQSKVDSYIEQAPRNAYEKLQRQKLQVVFGISNVDYNNNVYFGQYEQAGCVQPIKWRVLEGDDRLLLITEFGIDCKPYNQTETGVTWEKCSLRKWLNNEFLKTAFGEEESMIYSAIIKSEKNSQYDTAPGNDTCDKVFLLSISEVEKYLLLEEQRKCKPSEYAKRQWAYVDKDTGCASWWLRSPGNDSKRAAYVDNIGVINNNGDSVVHVKHCVRPALWINLDYLYL